MATTTHMQKGGRYCRNALRILVATTTVALGGYGYGAATAGSTLAAKHTFELTGARDARPFSYGWPVKPFDKQHPVRGNFADPRSVFHGPPTRRGLMTGRCSCSYHQGIDISAADGTAVYPVRSGVARIVTNEWVEIDSDSGAEFQYWHISPLVHVGDRVTADETVLGHIVHGAEHVHLTQLHDNRPVNPLAPGNIGPYNDTTVPQVDAVSFRASDTGPEFLPELVRGRVEIVAEAHDTPAISVPGVWHGLPITPARLTFRIESLPSHQVVVPETTAIDVSRTLPSTPDMWHTYARGTHMNMVQFGPRRYWFQPGVYLFKLTSAAFDTRRLPDRAYELTATAWDTAGNHSSTTQIFSIHNSRSWLNR